MLYFGRIDSSGEKVITKKKLKKIKKLCASRLLHKYPGLITWLGTV
jgi:hypothetical protein